MDYTPEASDVAYIKRFWGHLKIGMARPISGTAVVIKKESETEARILPFQRDAEMIEKLATTMAACGIKATVPPPASDSHWW